MTKREPVQATLFDVPPGPFEVRLFHDAAGNYGPDQWVVWGYLFCKRSSEAQVLEVLRRARQAENCWSPMRFADLPGGWGGAGGHKPRTAFRWIKEARWLLGSGIWFHSFALDTRGSGFDGSEFPRKFHLNNRFCRMGLASAIPWFFKGRETVSIETFFHRQSFEGGETGEDSIPGQDCDNLGDYIVAQTSMDSKRRHRRQPGLWPMVEFTLPVRFLSIDPEDEDGAYSSKCEMLQLTDILLGAVRQAIGGESKSKTKSELASMVGEWAADVRRKPWEQEMGLNRRFNVSYFPGPSGKAYSDGPLRLSRRMPGTKQARLGV